MEKKLIEKKFEDVKGAIGIALAAILLWNELPTKQKESFSLGDLFKFYKEAPDGHIKSSICEEIFSREDGTFDEWSKILDDSWYSYPELKLWATHKMRALAKTFSDYLTLYGQECDVVNELILLFPTATLREKIDAITSARSAEDKYRLRELILKNISVEDCIHYIYSTNDVSALDIVAKRFLPHKKWVQLYYEYGSLSPKELFVFLFHKRCYNVRTFKECADIIKAERFATRTTDTNLQMSKDIEKIRKRLIEKTHSREQIFYLFHNVKWWYRYEVSQVIQAFQEAPKFSLAELNELHNETHRGNDELKDFLVEEISNLNLDFDNLVRLWKTKGTRRCDSLLYRIFNAAETLEQYAVVYNLYYGFTDDELENNIRQKAFAQMQMLASQ